MEMKLKILHENKDKMQEHYKKRTDQHINCVKNCASHLADKNHDIADELLNQVASHDDSKWKEPEFTPYVYLTWRYKCQDDDIEFDMPDGMDDKIHKATWHHVSTNRHHPEYWDSDASPRSINKEDRDASPEKPIDATKMDKISLAEMVCDWNAMGLERGNTAKSWADKVVGSRFLFTEEQEELIYKYIDDLKDKKSFP